MDPTPAYAGFRVEHNARTTYGHIVSYTDPEPLQRDLRISEGQLAQVQPVTTPIFPLAYTRSVNRGD